MIPQEIKEKVVREFHTSEHEDASSFIAGAEFGYQLANQWVKESEQKPPFDTTVLVWCRIYGYYIGYYVEIEGTGYGNWHDGKNLGVLPPIWWMHMQPVPKEEINMNELPF